MKAAAFGVAVASGLMAVGLSFISPETAKVYALLSIAGSLFSLAFSKFRP